MDNYFSKYRSGVIGLDQEIDTPFAGKKRILYADWTASGRNYLPIEQRIQQEIMPLVGNTHTHASSTGTAMTYAYHLSQQIIKNHVNASADDIIITACSGMTRLVNKFQRILGMTDSVDKARLPENKRPVVFVTHMEHHSNHTSWLETTATVRMIRPTLEGLPDPDHLYELLQTYRDRPVKIASVTACSNVTGIGTPYPRIAQIMHEAGGYCFVDFSASAPYVAIDMHPADEGAALDAIFFSPHKFLGGPGSAGVLIFNKKLYKKGVPDHPGGGVVHWTSPWGERIYVDEIEVREDGGTPAFLQTIKSAMCIRLKEEMGTDLIGKRDRLLLRRLWTRLRNIPNLHILAPQHADRLAIVSFFIDGLHYSPGIRMLNDYFGIQCRGGCSCAGSYGHYLLNIDRSSSAEIAEYIRLGDFSKKPGWIRISLHPVMTEEETDYISDAIEALADNYRQWGKRYIFDPSRAILSSVGEALDSRIRENMNAALYRNFNLSDPVMDSVHA